MAVRAVPSAWGCSDESEGCVYRFGDTSGEEAQKNHRTVALRKRGVSELSRGGSNAPPGPPRPHPRWGASRPWRTLHALCQTCPPLPAGIRNAPNARRERDRPPRLVQLRS